MDSRYEILAFPENFKAPTVKLVIKSCNVTDYLSMKFARNYTPILWTI
jgi:hypothetical protein